MTVNCVCANFDGFLYLNFNGGENFMTENFIYDELPYPSYIFPQTHPDNLATIAKMHGMNPAKINDCRVLELGCGDGSNLNSIAYSLPSSRFVGVDLSVKHIDDANKAVAEIGLQNVEFYAQDVLEINAANFGKFDYIIAHGLFSWVPDFVRAKIRRIYSEMLDENGVGYISYNAFPGCHLRNLTREMMRFHVREIKEPLEQVESSLKFLEFLSENVEDKSFYGEIVRQEFSNIAERSRENIFHDDLSEINQPFYFTDFISEAEKNDLQFLSEAEVFSSQTFHLPPKAQELLAGFGDDVIKIEQYLDFIKGRRFRQTLLCHQNIKIRREMPPEIIREFYLSSAVKPVLPEINLEPQIVETFTSAKNVTFQIDHSLTKAALDYLGGIWTNSVSFDDLMTESVRILAEKQIIATGEDVEAAAAMLFRLYGANFVKLRTIAPRFTPDISDHPKVSDFARWQARRGQTVTTLSGLNFSLENDLIRQMLVLLDGENSPESVLNKLKMMSDQESAADIDELFKENLLQIAKSGLLIA